MDMLLSVVQVVMQYIAIIIGYLVIGTAYSIWWFWAMNRMVSRVYAKKKLDFSKKNHSEIRSKELALQATRLFARFWFKQKTVPIVVSECYWQLIRIIFIWPVHCLNQIVGVNFFFAVKKALKYLATWFKWAEVLYDSLLWMRRALIRLYGVEAAAKIAAKDISTDFNAVKQ